MSACELSVALTIDLESSCFYGLCFGKWLCVVYSCRRTYSSLDRGCTYRFHDSKVAMRATAGKNGCSSRGKNLWKRKANN
jgi:hypothetical protein